MCGKWRDVPAAEVDAADLFGAICKFEVAFGEGAGGC